MQHRAFLVDRHNFVWGAVGVACAVTTNTNNPDLFQWYRCESFLETTPNRTISPPNPPSVFALPSPLFLCPPLLSPSLPLFLSSLMVYVSLNIALSRVLSPSLPLFLLPFLPLARSFSLPVVPACLPVCAPYVWARFPCVFPCLGASVLHAHFCPFFVVVRGGSSVSSSCRVAKPSSSSSSSSKHLSVGSLGHVSHK